MMPQEEKLLVDQMVERQIRLLTLAEEHTDVVRRQGPEALRKAYDEAVEALSPGTGRPLVCPAMGEDMEEYYRRYEPLLAVNATTNVQHIYVSLVAMGLLHAQTMREFTRLSWNSQLEVGRRTSEHMRQLYNPNGPAQRVPDYLLTERLPILLPDSTRRNNARYKKLGYQQIAELLQDFPKLHLKELIETETGKCYQVVGINYSRTEPGKVDSYEVQLEGCRSAIMLSFNELKDVLRESHEIINI